MKSMTNSKARERGKKDVRTVFRALRIKDGLGDEEIKPDEFAYWYNKRSVSVGGSYIVYEVISTDPTHRADDNVIGREFFAQIDVFSVHGFETRELSDFIGRLEEGLLSKGFDVELEAENYEPDTRLYRQVFLVSKLYF